MTPREANLYTAIGARVRQARKARKMKQGELAEHIGVTRTTVVNLEAGRQATPLLTLVDLAEWLDVDPAWLVFGVLVNTEALEAARALVSYAEAQAAQTPPLSPLNFVTGGHYRRLCAALEAADGRAA